ncbi:MAG: hypothetical protein R2784_13785 [Saprospiraceae bacterium]
MKHPFIPILERKRQQTSGTYGWSIIDNQGIDGVNLAADRLKKRISI